MFVWELFSFRNTWIPFWLFCSQEQNSRNIFRKTFLFRNIPKRTRPKATVLIMIYRSFCIPLVVDRSQSRIPICLKFVLTNPLASNTRSLSSSHVIIIAWRRAIVHFTVTDARLVSSDHGINISVCHTNWLFLCSVFFLGGILCLFSCCSQETNFHKSCNLTIPMQIFARLWQ